MLLTVPLMMISFAKDEEENYRMAGNEFIEAGNQVFRHTYSFVCMCECARVSASVCCVYIFYLVDVRCGVLLSYLLKLIHMRCMRICIHICISNFEG